MRRIKQAARTLAVAPALALGRLGLTPNALTVVGSVLTASVGLIVANGWFAWGGLALWVFSATDTLDGALARATGRVTRFGAFLDSVCDRIAEAAIFFGLVWWYQQHGSWLGVTLAYTAVAGSLMVSYTRARAEGLGLTGADIGWLQRPERIVLLGIGFFLAPLIPTALLVVLGILAVFTLVTVIQRVGWAARLLGSAS